MTAADFADFLTSLRESEPDHHRDPIAHDHACAEADAGGPAHE